MRMVRISMALPLELYLGSSLFLPQLCIATKRSGKGTCTSTTTTKPKYKGNRETNFWPINGNLGTSNSMQSTDFRQIQDLGNNSIVMNTFPLIKLTNKNINRSTSFQRTHFKNDRRQNTNRGNIKRSLTPKWTWKITITERMTSPYQNQALQMLKRHKHGKLRTIL